MGLRLNPGEVKAMTSSASKAVSKYNAELRSGLSGISGVTNEHGLQGKAYSAFKFHMADHTLVVSSLIAAGEGFIKSLSSISAAVGAEILDEDKLNKSIKLCVKSIERYDRCIETYRSLLNDPTYYATSSGHAYSMISYYQDLKEKYETLKAKLEEKLKKLFEIDAKLTSIVSGMESLYNGIEAGIRSLEKGWNGTAFIMPVAAAWRAGLLSKFKDTIYRIITQLKNSVKGANNPQCCLGGDPVNLATGNFIYDKEDLVISGRTPFVFRRFYNSISEHKGAFGCDFNHNYELRLDIKEDDDGQIGATIHFEDGQEDTFIQVEDDRFQSYYGTLGSFERLEDEQGDSFKGYLYTKLDGTKYFFDENGLYTRQEDSNGNGFTLEYEDGVRLVKVTKDSGEYFVLSYNEEGYTAEVKDHTGRCAQYLYENDKLTKVVLPDGNGITYEYSHRGKLKAVTNPRGIKVLSNIFDGQDRTIQQEFPDGTSISYKYDDENQTVTMIERNGSRSVYYHDEAYRNTKVEYPNGTEEFTYNDKNQRTKVKDRNGNETHYTYDNKGNVTGIINALGSRLTLTYNGQNKPVTIKLDGKSKLKNIYDKKGNLIETIDAKGQKTSFAYDDKGNATKITQADGSIVEIAYDEKNNIKTLTNPDGSSISYEYDELNRVTSTTDALGNATTYKYDISGNITEVTNPAGQSQSFAYNESNKVTAVVGFNGAKTEYEYGSLNKPIRIIDPRGNKTMLEYDSMWNLAAVTKPNGGKTIYRYDENNYLSAEEDAKGGVAKYEYDGNGNRISACDAEGNKALLAYDALNRLIKVTAPDGSETKYEYDTESNLVKVIDALGNEVNAEYDELGRITRETNQLGAIREYDYDKLGNLEKVISKDDRGSDAVTSFAYKKGTDKVTAITYPDGSEEHYSYDANNNLISFIDRNGYKIAYTYDVLDRLTKAEGQEGDKKEYEYDTAGNITKVSDALGNATLYSYDLNNNLVKVTDALGNETAYDYDVNDELIMIRQYEGAEIDGIEASKITENAEALSSNILKFTEEQKNCHITHYTRNVLGQIEVITDAYGNQERFQYNKRGELISKLDKDGYLTKYAYTPAGDVAGIEYDDGRSVQMSYNSLRQLEEVKDWLGVTKITNNALGQAIGVTYPDGKAVGYEYDINGNRTALTYPDGKKVSYSYDELGRLSKLENDDHEVSYRYDAQSKLIEKTFANGVKTTYAYNRRGLLESLVHSNNNGVINEFSYEYDLLGNKTRVDKKRNTLHNDNGSYEYGYDPIGRLHTVEKDGSPLRIYNYDAYGNRTSLEDYSVSTTSPATTQYEYNSLNQLITKAGSIGAEHYSYDKRGNLSAITLDDAIKNTYVYGAINRLEQATNVKGEIAKYLYNGLGNRVGKQIGTVPTGTLRPAELDTPSPVDFHSERRIDYIVDLTMEYNNLLVKKNGDISNEYTFDAGLLFKNDELFINDELTSPVGRIGKNGVIIAQTSFDEFGVELAGNVDDDFTYIGYQQDAISGTYFAQKREYMPSAARFAGTDIFAGFAVHPLSLNKYTYCFNSPLILADFDGAWPEAIADIGNGFKAAGKWVSDHKSDIIKVVGTVAVVGAATAFTVATFGAGTAISAIAVSAAVGAGVGGTVNGVMNLKNGGSFGNGFIGGAISGAIQGGLGTALGPVGTILGGAGNGIGIATTETLDRIDGNNTKSTTEIIKDGFIGAGLGVVCSLPGGLIQAGVDGSWARNILSGEGYNSYKEIIKANTKFLKDLMPNYTRFFGERLVDVSGIFDNMLLNDMMNGCDND